MATQTKLQNEAILDEIARQIIHDLNIQAIYCGVGHTIENRKWHEDCINERTVDLTEDYSETYSFDDIWEIIINSELQNVYDSLELYSQKYVRDYVRDVYPDWRHSMG